MFINLEGKLINTDYITKIVKDNPRFDGEDEFHVVIYLIDNFGRPIHYAHLFQSRIEADNWFAYISELLSSLDASPSHFARELSKCRQN